MRLKTSNGKLFVFTLILLNILFLVTAANAQFVRSGFIIDSTNIYKDILEYKSNNPNTKPQNLVIYANSLVESRGINHSFILDDKICDVVDKEFAKKKNRKTNELFLKGTFVPEEGDATVLKFPVLRNNRGRCGRCLIKLPIAAVTQRHFMLILKGRMINFRHVNGFGLDKVDLLDNTDSPEIKHRWLIPFRSKPLGVSFDGSILYFDVPYQGLDELALELFKNGAISFALKKNLDFKESGLSPTSSSKDSSANSLSYLTFGKEKQTIRYSAPCVR